MRKCIFILFVCSLMIIPTHLVVADTENLDELSIEIMPNDALFHITNMKPGDWAPRTVTVNNNGLQAFGYQLHVINEGSDKLFNELILEIQDQDNELYNGKLADFNSFSSRSLGTAKSEELDITIHFPESSGNEFQGLNTQFTFIFTAEAQSNSNAIATTYIKGTIGSDEVLKSGILGLSPTTINNIKFFLVAGLTIGIGGGLFALNRRRIYS